MTGRRTPRIAVAATLAALSLAAAAFIRTHAAPAPAHYFATDQPIYLAIARAPFSADPQVHHAPHCWRILTPLAARAIGSVAGGPERGFLILTFASFAALPLAAWFWLMTLGASPAAANAGAGVMALAPPVVGLLAWDVVRVDAVSLLLLFAAATATVQGRGVLLCVLLAAMAFTKETALIGAFFALAWAVLVDRRLVTAAAIACALAVSIRALLPLVIVPAAVYPSDNLRDFKVVLHSLSASYVARRAILATAGTWNLLVPVVAVAAASRPRVTGRDIAIAVGLVAAFAQLLFATDNERIVAAAYPFVLAWCAIGLDRLDARRRRWLAVALIAAQLPWLLEMGRVWPVPPAGDTLPHVPPLRYVEIAILFASAGGVIMVWLRRR